MAPEATLADVDQWLELSVELHLDKPTQAEATQPENAQEVIPALTNEWLELTAELKPE